MFRAAMLSHIGLRIIGLQILRDRIRSWFCLTTFKWGSTTYLATDWDGKRKLKQLSDFCSRDIDEGKTWPFSNFIFYIILYYVVLDIDVRGSNAKAISAAPSVQNGEKKKRYRCKMSIMLTDANTTHIVSRLFCRSTNFKIR